MLTKEERRNLTRPERKALRRERALLRWPDTDGRPPWLVRAEGVLLRVSQRVAVVLVSAASTAVLDAATSTLRGGQLRHEFAVASLLAAAGAHAVNLGTKEAAGLVEDAYQVLDDEGRLGS